MIFKPNVSISRALLRGALPSLNQIFTILNNLICGHDLYLTFNSNIGDCNLLMVKDFVVLISKVSICTIEIIND
jgi:hypothetical protein